MQNKALNSKGVHRLWVALTILLYLCSCRAYSPLLPSGDRKIVRAFQRTDLDARHHVGLAVYDPGDKKWLLEHRDKNGFTPASNIKILTLYAALQTLDVQIDAAKYVLLRDSILIWGGGDPGTLYPDIYGHHPLVDFIAQREERVFFSTYHFTSPRYGPGWAWDDYAGVYQCERNAFPIYGNRLWIERKDDHISTFPHYLSSTLKVIPDTTDRVGRSEWGDDYTYHFNSFTPMDQRQVPIAFFANDIRLCWEEATHRSIQILDIPLRPDTVSLKGSTRDSVLQIMMHESDNFIADQLLLAVSFKQLGYMAEEEIIDTLLKGPLRFLHEDSIRWVDGSGLSRYNLMTPHATVRVLDRIYQKYGTDFITRIFPAGGVSGTLRDRYKGKNGQPYIYAKTGTLRHVHCLSGYLITRSGRVLIFSWMHNQITGDPAKVKEAMHSFFSFLYDTY